jgi:hypothetical protein
LHLLLEFKEYYNSDEARIPTLKRRNGFGFLTFETNSL